MLMKTAGLSESYSKYETWLFPFILPLPGIHLDPSFVVRLLSTGEV